MWSIGQPDVAVFVGGDARTRVVVRSIGATDGITPRLAGMVKGFSTDGGDRVQPDDVSLAGAGERFVGPVV